MVLEGAFLLLSHLTGSAKPEKQHEEGGKEEEIRACSKQPTSN